MWDKVLLSESTSTETVSSTHCGTHLPRLSLQPCVVADERA